jgi:putative ABC transport system substrate-binding protein
LAAKAATSAIPIIFISGTDPVKLGLVASLNRPGGNLTGVSFFSTELAAKRLGILRELIPQAKSIAVLVNPNNPETETIVNDVQHAARALGLQTLTLRAESDRDFESAFDTVRQQRAARCSSATIPSSMDGANNSLQWPRDMGSPQSVRRNMPPLEGS